MAAEDTGIARVLGGTGQWRCPRRRVRVPHGSLPGEGRKGAPTRGVGENRFGSAQRSVYRHFLLHLERYGEPRPGSKEEAGELGLKEGEEVAWDRRYQWERGKMLVVSGRRILDLVMANDFSQESVAKDAKLREHLAKVMHMEMFPRLYTDEEKAALTNESPGGQDASRGAA